MSSSTSTETPRFPSAMYEARGLVGDLFEHRPLVYWTDMVISAAVGWGVLAAAYAHPVLDAWYAVLVIVAGFALLRATLFIHELSHFRRGVLPGFLWAWNLLVATITMTPSFTYVGSHTDHHKRSLYGTVKDPEYLPLATSERWRILAFVLQMPLATPAMALRWGVGTPLSFVVPPLRKLLIEKASSLVINPDYVRRAPQGDDRRTWLILEVWMMLVVWAGVALFATGIITPFMLLTWYLATTFAAITNQIRTLAAHHYENAGDEMSTAEQLCDSVTVRGVPLLTELVFPVGLKHHALHHFLPDMPYHSLPEAHRRLKGALDQKLREPVGYDRTEHAGLLPVVGRLLRHDRIAGAMKRWRRKA